MNNLLTSLSLMLTLFLSGNTNSTEFISTDYSINKYYEVGKIDAKNVAKVISYNTKSEKIVKSVSNEAVSHSKVLIDCNKVPDKCTQKVILTPTPTPIITVKPKPSPILIPKPSIPPQPICPPPPCTRGRAFMDPVVSNDTVIPCMDTDAIQYPNEIVCRD